MRNEYWVSTVLTFNSCTKCVGSPGIIHDYTPDCQPVSGARMHDGLHNTTERSFDSHATWSIDVLVLFDMLSISICTTRHWQTSGRLVQELTVCTVIISTVQPGMFRQLASNATRAYKRVYVGYRSQYKMQTEIPCMRALTIIIFI